MAGPPSGEAMTIWAEAMSSQAACDAAAFSGAANRATTANKARSRAIIILIIARQDCGVMAIGKAAKLLGRHRGEHAEDRHQNDDGRTQRRFRENAPSKRFQGVARFSGREVPGERGRMEEPVQAR